MWILFLAFSCLLTTCLILWRYLVVADLCTSLSELHLALCILVFLLSGSSTPSAQITFTVFLNIWPHLSSSNDILISGSLNRCLTHPRHTAICMYRRWLMSLQNSSGDSASAWYILHLATCVIASEFASSALVRIHWVLVWLMHYYPCTVPKTPVSMCQSRSYFIHNSIPQQNSSWIFQIPENSERVVRWSDSHSKCLNITKTIGKVYIFIFNLKITKFQTMTV